MHIIVIATDMTKAQRDDSASYARISAMHPFKGFGQPEDIARAVLFLSSPDNSYMSGAMMTVDGGYTAM
jgi:NAD(P)-dependent dehydrogenase (short-subunit alcohol dehydrogenase family)